MTEKLTDEEAIDQYKRDIPLGGYYAKEFFSYRPSAELAAKEERRTRHYDANDDRLRQIELGLCKKYGVQVPRKWPNRRQDRGETGEQMLILGQTCDDRRNPKLWGIRQEDRTRHTYLLGPSGSGKSTLLHALGVEDMWYWRGGLLMEPHGDLALSLLKTAPPYRIHDIIYLNVLDPIASPGFNPLELPPNADDAMRQEAVGAVTTLMVKHFNIGQGAVQFQKNLENALNPLTFVPGATLLEVMDFYQNEDIRNTILSFHPNTDVAEQLKSTVENTKADDLRSLTNRFTKFTGNRFMKHLFGQSSTTLDFFDLMNTGHYIICPVSKGGTQDSSFLTFYGAYVISEVYKAATMRESIREDDRVNFALILDEFQNFMGDDIEGILAEARKYGLQLMLANQYLAQLTPAIRAAVLQNCSTMLSYNLASDDAPVIAKTMGGALRPEDLQAVPKYHVMASPLIRGGKVKPFISAVFPPISLKSDLSDITAELIKEVSRQRYMTERDEIDRDIEERRGYLIAGNKDGLIKLAEKVRKKAKHNS